MALENAGRNMKSILVISSLFISVIMTASFAGAVECMVDVYDVNVIGNAIFGSIANSGEIMSPVTYELYIEKGTAKTILKNGTITVAPAGVYNISHGFNFVPGDYMITLEASIGCGATDWESMGRIILKDYVCQDPQGYEGSWRCDYSRQRYYECRGTDWEIINSSAGEYCYNCLSTCGDGVCNCGESSITCRCDCASGSCTPGYLGDYRCYSDTLQEKFRSYDCSEEWRDIQDCAFGCENDDCIGGSLKPMSCGVIITAMDYQGSALIGEIPYVNVTVRNPSNRSERIDIILKVGNAIKGSYFQTLLPGNSFTKTFTYLTPPVSGKYDIVADATANCGTNDSMKATINVFETEFGIVIPPDAVVMPGPIENTVVEIYPGSIDLARGESKAITINIETAVAQSFNVQINGVDQSWLEYEREKAIGTKKSIYVYVTPGEAGIHELNITVTSSIEDGTYEKSVKLFVAPAEYSESTDTILGVIFNGIINIINYLTENIWALLVLILAGIIIVLLLGKRHLKTEYEDLI